MAVHGRSQVGEQWKLVELSEPDGSRKMSLQHPKLIAVFPAFPELRVLNIKYDVIMTEAEVSCGF